MRQYQHADFVAHPGKYQLFRTAVVARQIVTENAERDLAPGTIVGIAYRCTARNQIHRRDEPVYTVRVNGATWGDMYANNLADFVL